MEAKLAETLDALGKEKAACRGLRRDFDDEKAKNEALVE